MLKAELPAFMLFDIMLPDEDRIIILGKMKSSNKTADIPIIMATAKGMEYNKVTGLGYGADNYLVKPLQSC